MSTRWKLLFALLASLQLTGCAVFGIRKQVKSFNELAYYTGSVVRAEPSNAPVVVALVKPGEQTVAAYDLLPTGGRYHLVALPGHYSIVAFEDTNGNFICDAGERSARLDGEPLDARKTEPRDKAYGTITIPSMPGASVSIPIDLSASGLAKSMPRRSANLGTVTTLDDPRFSLENANEGLWKPYDFIQHNGPGIFMLQPYDPKKIPVILVHGIGGTPTDFREVVGAIDHERFQPWVYYYPSGFSIAVNGWFLDHAIEELRSRLGIGDVDIVAHSMGGLVARASIYSCALESRCHVSRFISISTPWDGHRSAILGAKTAPVPLPCWEDMAPGSEFLERLHAAALPAGVEYSLLFGFGGDSKMMVGGDDGTVQLTSVLFEKFEDEASLILGFDANHVDILKQERLHRVLGKILADGAKSVQPLK